MFVLLSIMPLPFWMFLQIWNDPGVVSFTDPWGKGAYRNQETGCRSHGNAKVPHQCHFPKEMSISPCSLFINHHWSLNKTWFLGGGGWHWGGFLLWLLDAYDVYVHQADIGWIQDAGGFVRSFQEFINNLHAGKLTCWTPKIGNWEDDLAFQV